MAPDSCGAVAVGVAVGEGGPMGNVVAFAQMSTIGGRIFRRRAKGRAEQSSSHPHNKRSNGPPAGHCADAK